MYKLVYTHRAVKDVKRLNKNVKKRIAATLLRFKKDPFCYAEKLTNPVLGTYRFRIGDYRVIFDVVADEIVILRIGHRRDIYKR